MNSQTATEKVYMPHPSLSKVELPKGIRPAIVAAFSALFLTLAACAGGGSAGTGLKVFTGQVIATNGSPLADVEVAVVDTGAAALTQDDGSFRIQTEVGGGEVQVDVTSQGVMSSITVTELPAGDAEVELSLQVNEETNEVESVDVTITSTEGEDGEEAEEDEESDINDESDDAHDSDSEDDASNSEAESENGEDAEEVEGGEDGESPEETPPSAEEEVDEPSEGDDSPDSTEEDEPSDETDSPDSIDQ